MALDTVKFINELIHNGYTHLCVVPCSFAKNVINEAINNPNIEYVPGASEAVACSISAGLKIAGKSPIVIIQSSGVTNIGSCITSLLKPYGIKFPILSSWRTYKEGDSEIQHKHLAKELPKLLEAYGYEHCILDIENIENALEQINLCSKEHVICMIEKDSFTKIELDEEHVLNLSMYTPRSEFLIKLNEEFKSSDVVFIGTTGNTAREMYTYMPDSNNFYMAGNMGGALSLGLGCSMAGKKIIVCGGDAEFVMHMGGLTTTGRYKNNIDLTYILFDNESNKSTGGQNTYQNHVHYRSIAKASGFNVIGNTLTTLNDFSNNINNIKKTKCLNFMHVKCGIDDETPRPPLDLIKVNKL
jgi:phosphonopyruvate decarboxylase